MTGGPVSALHDWMATARIEADSLFRDQSLGYGRTPGSRSKSINDILKHRAQLAGLDPAEFSAHGLRSGYLTEAANRGVPLQEAMEQSRHRSVQQASSYYNSATRKTGRAARLLWPAHTESVSTLRVGIAHGPPARLRDVRNAKAATIRTTVLTAKSCRIQQDQRADPFRQAAVLLRAASGVNAGGVRPCGRHFESR